MNTDDENLIDTLTSDLKQSNNTRVMPVFSISGIWLCVAFFVTGLLMYAIKPYRPDVIHQFFSTPLFSAELIIGFLALCFLCLGVFQSAVPGEKTTLLNIGMACYGVWILIIFSGFFNPILKPSMLGKREECYFEAIYYSVGLIIFTAILLRRRYALRPKFTGVFSALLVASIPAYLMQIACMHEAEHALTHHLLPALLTTIFLAPLVYWILKKH